MRMTPSPAAGVVSTAISNAPKARRASPSQMLARKSIAPSVSSILYSGNARSSEMARRSRPRISSGERASSWKTSERLISAPITENCGFSVVAPIRRIVPLSTSGSRESCWALLKRWISSMKRMVFRPLRRRSTAHWISLRMSETVEKTPERRTNSELLFRAMISASVVLPVPGGPKRIMELNRSESMARRSSFPGASRCC